MENDSRGRTGSYGQLSGFTPVDRFGIFLSKRKITRYLKKCGRIDLKLLDLGCGFHALMLKAALPYISGGVGVDIAVSDNIKRIPNVQIIENTIEGSFPVIEDSSFDVVLLNSVLEHMDDPLSVLKESRRVLVDGGSLFINVPTWLGKVFLETSAFILKLSPKAEIDDHRMYYDKKDLWPLIVKAGFRSSSIHMSYYKFGLNLFSVCVKK